MAYTLVHANTILDNTGSKLNPPYTVTCTSTTAHNLLVLGWSGGWSAVNYTGLTGPSGWTQAVNVNAAGGFGGSGIWYLPDCPAGITSVSVTWAAAGSNGYGFAQILEFNDAAGTNTSPLDVTGSVNNDVTTPVPVATGSATTAASELAVSIFGGFYSTATKDTVTQGTGFTNAGGAGQATKVNLHGIIDYQLNTGSAGSTPTDSVTFTGPFTTNATAGVIATFAIFTAPPPGLLPQRLQRHGPKQALARPSHTAGYRS